MNSSSCSSNPPFLPKPQIRLFKFKMGRALSKSLFLAALTISQMLILLSISNTVVAGQTCQGDFQGLVTQCARFVQKYGPVIDPPQSCCTVIQSVNVPCVCQHVTKEVEQIIDMNKVVHVAQFCGKPLPRGTKCGSSIVP